MDLGRFPAASSHSHGMRSASGLRLGAKSRPRGWPDRLLEEYQFQNEKNMVPEGFELELSTLRRCNLTMKTHVFLNIFTLSLLSVLPVILSRGGSKNASKSISKGFQNHSTTIFDGICVLETLLEPVWNDFGLPNGFPKEVLEASSRLSKTYSFQRGLPGGCQNGF